MDLISALSSQLGVGGDQAQAIAGSVFGAVQARVKEQLGDGPASQLASAVPEIGGWQQAAGQLLGGLKGGGAPGGLGDALGGLLGGGGQQQGGGLGDALGGLLGGGGQQQGGGLGDALGGLLGGGGQQQGGGLGDALGGLLGGAGGLAGALGGLLGGSPETQALVGVLGKIGLDPSKAAAIAPLALDFLKSRLNPELLGTILKVVPFLSGGQGGLAGALGGLLGGKS